MKYLEHSYKMSCLLALSRYPMDTFAEIGIFRLNMVIEYNNVNLEIFY